MTTETAWRPSQAALHQRPVQVRLLRGVWLGEELGNGKAGDEVTVSHGFARQMVAANQAELVDAEAVPEPPPVKAPTRRARRRAG